MYKISAAASLLMVALLSGCSTAPKAPSVAGNIRTSLEQAGLKDVSVQQDQSKGVVTLSGKVATDADKSRADQIAQSLAAGQVVANEVAVLPATDAGPTKTFYADIDKGIDSNLDAALISSGHNDGIHHSVKNGVITLTGTVDTGAERTAIEATAHGIQNVQQVVNEIQTRHQKATSSN